MNLAPDAARVLVDLIGEDLGRMDNEMAKLAIEADGAKQPVTAERVASSVAFQREQEMWDLSNALASGDAAEALRRWRHFVQLDPLPSSARSRGWACGWRTSAAPSAATHGRSVWKYKDRLPQMMRTSRQLGPVGPRPALDLLAEIDHQSKTGVGDAAANVERFILQIATAGITAA